MKPTEIATDDPRTQYIAKAFERTNRKKYENYVVTGVWHRLRAKGILLEPVTQQYVKRPKGYALLDLFFPALDASVECDEKHHLSQEAEDRQRTQDIIEGSKLDPLRAIAAVSLESFKEYRVVCATIPESGTEPTFNPIEKIDAQIEKVANAIAGLWERRKRPEWDPRPAGEKFRDAGIIRVADRWVFRTHEEVLSAFGFPRPKDQNSTKRIRDGLEICFMTLTRPNVRTESWNNVLSDDGTTIEELAPRTGISDRAERGWRAAVADPTRRLHRIVFGKASNAFGIHGYVFLGEFEATEARFDLPRPSLVWKRVSDTAKTNP